MILEIAGVEIIWADDTIVLDVLTTSPRALLSGMPYSIYTSLSGSN